MSDTKTVKLEITSRGETYAVSAGAGQSVLEALRQASMGGENVLEKIHQDVMAGESVENTIHRHPDLVPPAPCGGRGKCGRCRVILDSPGDGGTVAFHVDELATLSDAERASGVRLACRLAVADGMRLHLEELGAARIETRVEGLDEELDPVLVKKAVILPLGSLEDQRSSAARLEDALGLESGSLPSFLTRCLPSIPDGSSSLTLVLEEGVPVAVDVGADTSETLWAAAVDIGTTTVAMYLVNLVDGSVRGSRADLNRQAPYGADVISRLEYARKGDAEVLELQTVIVSQLSELLEGLCSDYGAAAEDIHLLAVAGNTAMIHLLASWDARGLGEAPFLPAALQSPAFPAGEIGMKGFPRLRIWPLPSLSAYVGADITGGLVASGIKNRARTDLLLDIGTNGEMALGGSAGLVCCSTAAGPAFEGAQLSCGVGSIPGAVDHVDWIDGSMSYSTIEGAAAAGFCGSGVVDLVAFLVQSGLMDDTGRIVESIEEDAADSYAGLTITSGKTGAELFWREGAAEGRPLGFTQKDLREVQLAKAAIRAGVDTLLGQAGLGAEDIDTLWLAGGFGSYIRPESAAAIGLIPPELASRTRSLGNAAARGALLCLLSRKRRDESRDIAREAKTIELSGRPDFQNAYIEAMMFMLPEKD